MKDNNMSVSTFDFPPSKNEPLRYVCSLTLTNYYTKTISKNYFFYCYCVHSEFDSSSKLFVNSFPTLFPGGIGDIYDEKRGETDKAWWAKHLLKYYNGRFERHKMFALYAYNMLLRKENSKNSGFFLKNWFQSFNCGRSSKENRKGRYKFHLKN